MNLYICGQKAFGKSVFEMALAEGHNVVGVSAPLTASSRPDWPDRLREAAASKSVPVLPPGLLNADTLPSGIDLIVSAHSHDFIGRKTRLKASLGAIGFHPSLLPRHRGRDAVRWTVKMGDPVTGGTVYWLSDKMDGGDIAAQEHALVPPGISPGDLWRDVLFTLGVELMRKVLRDLSKGLIVAVPQDERHATWEPSWDRPPAYRPDRLLLGSAPAGFQVCNDFSALLQAS